MEDGYVRLSSLPFFLSECFPLPVLALWSQEYYKNNESFVVVALLYENMEQCLTTGLHVRFEDISALIFAAVKWLPSFCCPALFLVVAQIEVVN